MNVHVSTPPLDASPLEPTERRRPEHREAAWVLIAAFALSVGYELYRATVKHGTSRHDSMGDFVAQLPTYVIAGVGIWWLFSGRRGGTVAGSAVAAVGIAVSMLYYNPEIMMERRPGPIDWFEDLTFTGLLFVVLALLVAGRSGISRRR